MRKKLLVFLENLLKVMIGVMGSIIFLLFLFTGALIIIPVIILATITYLLVVSEVKIKNMRYHSHRKNQL